MKRLNLRLPPSRRPLKLAVASSLLALVILGAGTRSMILAFEISRLQAQRARLQGEVLRLEAELQKLRPRFLLAEQVEKAVAALKSSSAPLAVRTWLEAAAPQDLWLTSLTFGSGEVRATGEALRWQSVDEFVRALRSSGAMVILESVSRQTGQAQTYMWSVSIIVPGGTP